MSDLRRAALFAVVALCALSTAAAAATTRLVITGAFDTSSDRVVSHEEACGHRSDGRLIYSSDPMRIGSRPPVARVEFFIRRYRGLGRYKATAPAPYGRTAVQIVTARNATTGVASGFYVATSGTISVTQAKSGSLIGTVHAKLRLQRGSARVSLDGSWHCRVGG
jgi:hypothetical protein